MRKAALQSSINIYSSTRFSDAYAAEIHRRWYPKNNSLMPLLSSRDLVYHLCGNGKNFYGDLTFSPLRYL
jgi:hypothetical protein